MILRLKRQSCRRRRQRITRRKKIIVFFGIHGIADKYEVITAVKLFEKADILGKTARCGQTKNNKKTVL